MQDASQCFNGFPRCEFAYHTINCLENDTSFINQALLSTRSEPVFSYHPKQNKKSCICLVQRKHLFFQRNRTISALMDLSRRSHRFGYREHGRTPVLPAPFHAYWVIQISSGAEQASQKSRWQETKLQRRVNGGTRFEVR